MALKRSDKIIAVLGVIILIVAGFGIFLYASSDEDNGDTPTMIDDEETYNIYYEESPPLQASPDNEDYSIRYRFINQGAYKGNVLINQKNLKTISIKVEYVDNIKGIFFGRFLPSLGADTLSVKILDSDGEVINKGNIVGDRKKNLTFTMEAGSLISLDKIKADDKNEAYNILEDRYVDYEESFTIKASLDVGFWGRIRERLSRDTFDLMITYTYYEYSLEEPDGNNPPDEPDDNMPPIGGYAGLGMYSATNFFGKL
jgi:hypothetical protein